LHQLVVVVEVGEFEVTFRIHTLVENLLRNLFIEDILGRTSHHVSDTHLFDVELGSQSADLAQVTHVYAL
jgi:hypothetical protein